MDIQIRERNFKEKRTFVCSQIISSNIFINYCWFNTAPQIIWYFFFSCMWAELSDLLLTCREWKRNIATFQWRNQETPPWPGRRAPHLCDILPPNPYYEANHENTSAVVMFLLPQKHMGIFLQKPSGVPGRETHHSMGTIFSLGPQELFTLKLLDAQHPAVHQNNHWRVLSRA